MGRFCSATAVHLSWWPFTCLFAFFLAILNQIEFQFAFKTSKLLRFDVFVFVCAIVRSKLLKPMVHSARNALTESYYYFWRLVLFGRISSAKSISEQPTTVCVF